MPIEVIGFLMDTAGKLLVAYTSIMVHHRFRQEHKVDEEVFDTMMKEQVLGYVGIFLIIVGSVMELSGKL